MEQAGYKLENVYPQFQDFFDMLATSTQFSLYQIQRAIKHQDKRSSIGAYLKSLLVKINKK